MVGIVLLGVAVVGICGLMILPFLFLVDEESEGMGSPPATAGGEPEA